MADVHHHDHEHGHAHAPASFGFAFAVGIALNSAFVVAEVVFGPAWQFGRPFGRSERRRVLKGDQAVFNDGRSSINWVVRTEHE